MSRLGNTEYTSQEIDNSSFDKVSGVRVTELVDQNGELMNSIADKIPTYDLYITYNPDGSTNQKIWKKEATTEIVKTLTYNYSGGNLISKIIS